MLTGAVLTAATSAAARLRERGESVAVAESSTGGLIAAALVAPDGASRYFRGGFVFYTLESMATQLADASAIECGERSATEQRARWVADCARARLAADWGVGETAAAGPRPNRYGDRRPSLGRSSGARRDHVRARAHRRQGPSGEHGGLRPPGAGADCSGVDTHGGRRCDASFISGQIRPYALTREAARSERRPSRRPDAPTSSQRSSGNR